MNYNILINDQFWKTLTYPTVTPAQVILAEITKAQNDGEFAAFATPDGTFNFEIRSQN